MFPGPRNKKPLSLNNVLNRIKPVLNRCAKCNKAKAEHIKAGVEHEHRRDERLPQWRGSSRFVTGNIRRWRAVKSCSNVNGTRSQWPDGMPARWHVRHWKKRVDHEPLRSRRTSPSGR